MTVFVDGAEAMARIAAGTRTGTWVSGCPALGAVHGGGTGSWAVVFSFILFRLSLQLYCLTIFIGIKYKGTCIPYF
jgi:hypothetical protein